MMSIISGKFFKNYSPPPNSIKIKMKDIYPPSLVILVDIFILIFVKNNSNTILFSFLLTILIILKFLRKRPLSKIKWEIKSIFGHQCKIY